MAHNTAGIFYKPVILWSYCVSDLCRRLIPKRAINVKKELKKFSAEDESRIIEMAWEDRTPFEAIALQFGLNESQVIAFMRGHVKKRSFNIWRQRVSGRSSKHLKLRNPEISRGYCPTQYKQR
ncbi:TIGR03643 family protein [Leucothrix pacifica]|uniref:TIGR03643 family protein n=1 Tax=Leucothrix pacifica TaxID=1247513 RepID=A0A317CFS2_9GAMM|nr:TIGR03643 family protein [Leucothrix pacifica]